ncbi:alanine racemase [Deinococcus lacus]|uniref:Alanine racemase n=1 Tax=Deinococcus lacus TaxID=392561 RepID=A0ABW1YA25_9DEIO
MRAQALISESALHHNLRLLSARAAAPLLLPVKANAYGHGLETVARLAAPWPEVWGFGVATPDEAHAVADLNLGKPVLLFGGSYPHEWPELAARGVRLTVSTLEAARTLPPGAQAHLKVNTGMHRLGAAPAEAAQAGHALAQRGQLEGLYTHFLASEEEDPARSVEQLRLFLQVAAKLPRALLHCANSGSVLRHGALAGMDLARPGLASYGVMPAPLSSGTGLRPVMTLRAPITHIHTVPAGDTVSYGGLWQAPKDSVVATVAAGYADGYPRGQTNPSVRVAGDLRPVLGRICMDQLMVDVTGLTVQPGDWVTLWGEESEPPLSEVVTASGIMEYELLTGVASRVIRLPIA